MKVVIQRSRNSKVIVENEVVGEIQKGLVLLVCFEKGDSKDTAKKASEKILKLRILQDDQGRMNKNILDDGGEVLAISQFTLSWDGRKGNRPSFDNSMGPDQANKIFEYFVSTLREVVNVQTGKFGAHMDVHIENDGPVTFSLSFL